MKIESILELWQEDCQIDRTKIDLESLNTSVLHAKYHRIYTQERLLLRRLEADAKTLRLEKYEFLTQGPSKETEEKSWRLPPSGRILKTEVNNYLEADREIIDLNLRIGIQLEKIELLESIIRSISTRGFQIKNYIDYQRFISGLS